MALRFGIRRRGALAWVVGATFYATSSFAGPPYVTDDPVPVDLHHWEIYLATAPTFDASHISGAAPMADVNVGVLPGVHAHVLTQLAVDVGPGGAHFGVGDSELGAKIRVLRADGDTFQVSTYPTLTLPTGRASAGLGSGGYTVLLPLWLWKSFGLWDTYGGAAARIRTAKDALASAYLGWVAERRIGRTALGLEVFGESPTRREEPYTFGYSVGSVFDLSEVHHLLVSVGQTTVKPVFHAYLGWQFTFEP